MTDEIMQILLTAGAGTGGVILAKVYDNYKKSKSKTEKADALDKMYSELKNMYLEDTDLQRRLKSLAKENENLKELIKDLKNGS